MNSEQLGTLSPNVHDRVNAVTIGFDPGCGTGFVDYAIELISHFLGIRLIPCASPQEVDVYYGKDDHRPCALRIPKLPAYGVQTVPGLPSAAQAEIAHIAESPFPFDLFEALHFWLSDKGNATAPANAYDEHDRLLPMRSFQEAIGVREIPIVNAYLLLFGTWLGTRMRLDLPGRLPQGKKCIIVLSHDVDNPIDSDDYSHSLRLARLAMRQGKPRTGLRQLRNGCSRAKQRLMGKGERYWCFREIMDAESSHGFRSTFFFAATSSVEGHHLDVQYEVNAPEFRALLRDMRGGSEWEAGLHISYNARDDSTSILREKSRLEQIANREIKGSRHHYWHMSRPFWKSLEHHEKAGMLYDTSIAFNDAPGYRLGIAYPFHPWSPVLQRPISTIQIPTLLMDGGFFYQRGQTLDGVLEHMSMLLNRLKEYRGVAAIDWHDYTSFPASSKFRHWGEAYLRILEMLAADKTIAVKSCEQALDGLAL
jgi:hypothetical protein